jgi:predicted dehydrogenase
MVQVALVGCAHIHTPGFVKRLQARQDVKVVAVWDEQPGRAAVQAEALGSKTVADIAAIWSNPQISGVIITSETNKHQDLVLAAATAKKHMFVEKPLGLGKKDATVMANAVEEAGVLFQTGYFSRGNPIHLFLKEQIALGRFGRITRFRHTNCHAGSLRGIFDTDYRWMADPAIAGMGAFGDLGTHSLDIMMWLMGDVESVIATTGVATARYGDCDEFGEGLLRFKNGVAGSLAAGWVDVAHPVSLILSGTEGHAYVANGKLYYQSAQVAGADGQQPWTELPEAWPHAFELFLDALNGKPATLVSVREAAARSVVMEAFYKSVRSGRWASV